jgi:hypothetical protein
MQANLGAAGARTAYVGGDDLVSRSPERESRGIRRARASVASAPSGGRRKAPAGAAADAAHGAAAARGRCGRADEHAANLWGRRRVWGRHPDLNPDLNHSFLPQTHYSCVCKRDN